MFLILYRDLICPEVAGFARFQGYSGTPVVERIAASCAAQRKFRHVPTADICAEDMRLRFVFNRVSYVPLLGTTR
jgi:hypothetical protein